jgi:hypothetical protein
VDHHETHGVLLECCADTVSGPLPLYSRYFYIGAWAALA